MRTTPLVGRKAWFGPRRLGWGLGPVSPEGWAVSGIAVVAAVVVLMVDRHSRWEAFIVVIVLIAVTILKGTSPGGPREWEEFQAQRKPGG